MNAKAYLLFLFLLIGCTDVYERPLVSINTEYGDIHQGIVKIKMGSGIVLDKHFNFNSQVKIYNTHHLTYVTRQKDGRGFQVVSVDPFDTYDTYYAIYNPVKEKK